MLFKTNEHERVERESRLVRVASIVNAHKSGFLQKFSDKKTLDKTDIRIDAGISDNIMCHVVFSFDR